MNVPRRIEALADALARMYGWHDPQSDAYRLRNPLLLRAFSPKHAKDENGRRVFASFIAGYENALLDLKIKCSGKGRARIGPESPLVDLVTAYGNPSTAADYVVRFLRHALQAWHKAGDEAITKRTLLGWFLEEPRAETRDLGLGSQGSQPTGKESNNYSMVSDNAVAVGGNHGER